MKRKKYFFPLAAGRWMEGRETSAWNEKFHSTISLTRDLSPVRDIRRIP